MWLTNNITNRSYKVKGNLHKMRRHKKSGLESEDWGNFERFFKDPDRPDYIGAMREMKRVVRLGRKRHLKPPTGFSRELAEQLARF